MPTETTKGFPLTGQPIEAGTYPTAPTVTWSGAEKNAKITTAMAKIAVSYPDSTAMRCLLENMRDNPGAISSSAAIGAAAWALGRIGHLEDMIRHTIAKPELALSRGRNIGACKSETTRPILGDLIPREPAAPEEPEKRELWCERTSPGCDFPDCPCGWP